MPHLFSLMSLLVRRLPARERGHSTAEYAVGTLGAVTVAGVLVGLGFGDGWFADQLRDLLQRALDPVALVEHLRRGAPWTGFGR